MRREVNTPKTDIFYNYSLGVNRNQPRGTRDLKTQTSIPARQFMPLIQCHPCDGRYLNRKGVTMFRGFPWNRWPYLSCAPRTARARYASRIWLKVSWYCKFHVIIRIMIGLLERYLWSTLGLRASLWFWLHHSPRSEGASQTTPTQPRSLSHKTHSFV